MKMYLFVFAAALSLFCAPLRAQEPPVIEVGLLSTTHMIFKTDVIYVDIPVLGVLKYDVVQKSKNILAFKAAKPFDFDVTLTVLETNGSMHVYYVRYAEKPSRHVIDNRVPQVVPAPVKAEEKASKPVPEGTVPVAQGSVINVTSEGSSNFSQANAPTLEEVVGMDRGLFHIGARSFGIEVFVSNIFAYSDLTYIVLTIVNKSDIGYEAGEPQLMKESKRKGKQALKSEDKVFIKSIYGSLSCRPHSSSTVGITIEKQTLLPMECLSIYVYENTGNRNVVLSVRDKDLNYAVSPK